MEYHNPIFDECKIIIGENGEEKNISIDDINIEEDKTLIDEWKKNNKGKDTIHIRLVMNLMIYWKWNLSLMLMILTLQNLLCLLKTMSFFQCKYS